MQERKRQQRSFRESHRQSMQGDPSDHRNWVGRNNGKSGLDEYSPDGGPACRDSQPTWSDAQLNALADADREKNSCSNDEKGDFSAGGLNGGDLM